MDGILALYQNYRFTILTSFFGLTVAATVWLGRDGRLDTIPGPKGYPLLGIGWKLPPKAAATFRDWATEYGDVFKVRVGWYDWVILNTPEAVREILEKQANITASKIPAPMGHDIVTGGNRLFTMPYGPHQRTLRSLIRPITTIPMTTTLVPSQEFEAKQLLFDIATNNEDQRKFYQHNRRYVFSSLMTNTFGTRIKDWDHPDAQNAVRSQAILGKAARPGNFIVDEVPPLTHLPKWLHPGRKEAEAAAKEVSDIKMGLLRRLEKQLAAGKAPYCYAREVLENKESWYAQGLTDEDFAWAFAGLVEAGFETTSTTLNSLMLQLAANQQAQNEVQEELTRVVGPNRLPTFPDMPNLPYVRACVKEMLRMQPIFAPGVRRLATEDVVYKDHVIPKGTVLLANTPFLHYDPQRFDKPFEFMPQRYLGHTLYSAEYGTMSDPYKRDHFTFSTGRRFCPGARLAENSLDIALASILWAFEIRPPLVNGVEAKMDTSDNAYIEGGLILPKPFAARFLPRDEGRLRIIQQQWEIAMREGYELRGVSVGVDGVVEH